MGCTESRTIRDSGELAPQTGACGKPKAQSLAAERDHTTATRLLATRHLKEMLSYGQTDLPGLVDGKVVSSGRVPSKPEIAGGLSKARS